MPDYQITCPYCFETFRDDQVHFRMETVLDSADVAVSVIFEDDKKTVYHSPDEAEADPNLPEGMRQRVLRRFHVMSGFVQGEDPVYSKFWKQYGGTTEYASRNDAHPLPWLRPVHDPIAEPEFFKRVAEFSDGLVDRIVDDRDRTTARRVCPYCHNPLPKGYGRYPVKHIGVIGLPGAGKTVYLSRLCGWATDEFRRVGIQAVPLPPVNEYRLANMVASDTPLPAATKPHSLQQPLCFNLSYQNRGREHHLTLVFHDISGEDCQVSHDSASLSANARQYAPFLEHADGILMLVDPAQLKEKNAANGPQSLLTVLYDLFAGRTAQLGRIPLAVCISKGDTEPYLLSGESQVFASVKGAAGMPVFHAEEYNRTHAMLAAYVQNNATLLNTTLSTQYPSHNLFVVSALGTGTGVEQRTAKDGTAYTMPARPQCLIDPVMWLLNRFGFIESTGLIAMPSEWACPGCNRQVPGNVGYCPECGVGRDGDWKCLLCGTVNPADNRQCSHEELGILKDKPCKGIRPATLREVSGTRESFTDELKLPAWSDVYEREAMARSGDLEAQLAIFSGLRKNEESAAIRYWGNEILENKAIRDNLTGLYQVWFNLPYSYMEPSGPFQWTLIVARSGIRKAGVAQYELGSMYFAGIYGVPKNLERARYWYEQAANNNCLWVKGREYFEQCKSHLSPTKESLVSSVGSSLFNSAVG